MNTKHPCVFSTQFHKEQINLRLAGGVKSPRKVPFGDFTKTWRQEHCARINPYGSESCPYPPEDCSIAFLNVAQRAMDMDNPGAYFRVHAKYTGLDRAENKPLARERYTGTYGQQGGSTGVRGGPRTGPDDDLAGQHGSLPSLARRVAGSGPVDLHRAAPRSLGSLLRGDDQGSRSQPYRRNESQESTDNDGDTGDPVSPSPSERLGDQPPSGDPDLHQGG